MPLPGSNLGPTKTPQNRDDKYEGITLAPKMEIIEGPDGTWEAFERASPTLAYRIIRTLPLDQAKEPGFVVLHVLETNIETGEEYEIPVAKGRLVMPGDELPRGDGGVRIAGGTKPRYEFEASRWGRNYDCVFWQNDERDQQGQLTGKEVGSLKLTRLKGLPPFKR